MIDREYNKMVLVCDVCGEEVKGFEDFEAVLAYKNENGWKSKLGINIALQDDWIDVCSNCQR